ncbi:hypothetical protein [Chitinophaga filiformis]|uniref:YD repeat-containing protein n=1 Tax=Chitinophaga filiformis TaxID=104663 RepID=A0A1G7VAY2_CHIFI|nr:hypothetical protein [Chitinophaga filiformis]SDG56874.1 YD repeat-containing protein [Chitinophaga filiformis]
MKKVLYLLMFVVACKSSSSEKEADRIALITEKVLNDDITTAFRPEIFEGEIEHISEVIYKEDKAADGYLRKDTASKEYLFKDHRLHQIAAVTVRMSKDTLTIRYDTAGRILALINSDDRSRYNTDSFRYDAAGRRIEKMNRIYSTETRHLYEYNKAGDSLMIRGGDGNDIERIYIKEKGDVVTVTREFLAEGFRGGSYVYEYDEQNRPVTLYYYSSGGAESKVIEKYDSRGNLVKWEYHRSDRTKKDAFGGMDAMLSHTVEYTYDNKGNWTSKKEQAGDKNWSEVTTRKITYR